MVKEITNSVNYLRNRKIILYATDTVWALGCDATNQEAIKKIYNLKNREESKSLVVLVSGIEMLEKYIPNISDKAIDIIENSENATTIIYENPIGLAFNAIASDNTVAIRIPKHEFCIKLIEEFGKPIVSTSANISGNLTPKSFSEIDKSILEGVDYIVDLDREKITEKSSTILKLVGEEIIVIRP